MPDAPVSVLPVPSAGSPPSVPPSVLPEPSAAIPISLRITGITSPPLPGGQLIVEQEFPEEATWVDSVIGLSVFRVDGKWKIQATFAGTYDAEKASNAPTPVGLTGWTILAGAGQPVVEVDQSIEPPAGVLS